MRIDAKYTIILNKEEMISLVKVLQQGSVHPEQFNLSDSDAERIRTLKEVALELLPKPEARK